MCEIYILRHGRTALDNLKRSDGWLDLPLSDKGRLGLIQAQQYLKMEKVATIHAAPLRRTEETAHIIASGVIHGPNVKTAPAAMTWDLGVLAGTPKEESKPKVKRLLAHPTEKPMGGETHNAFRKRYMDWFDGLVAEAEESGEPVVVIVSGTNARLLGAELLGNSDAIDLDEGGLAVLHHEDGKWHEQILFGDENKSPYIS
jgi:probable phosphoglycerate mutase